MNVRLRSELAAILASSLYELFKQEIFEFIKGLEYMTQEEFENKFSNQSHFELTGYRIYFSRSGHDVILKSIEPS